MSRNHSAAGEIGRPAPAAVDNPAAGVEQNLLVGLQSAIESECIDKRIGNRLRLGKTGGVFFESFDAERLRAQDVLVPALIGDVQNWLTTQARASSTERNDRRKARSSDADIS